MRAESSVSPLRPFLALCAAGLGLCLSGPVQAAQQSVPPDDALIALRIEIGTPVSEASKMLVRAGYKQVSPCSFRRDTPGMRATVFLSVQPGRPSCDAGDEARPVIRVSYNTTSASRDVTPPEMVARLNRELGTEPSCARLQKLMARCAWHMPPRLPNAKLVELYHVASTVTLRQQNPDWTGQSGQSAAGAVSTTDPLSPISDIDLLAPGGIRIGMTVGEAHAALTAAGFSAQSYGRAGQHCQWRLVRQHERTVHITVQETANGGPDCREAAEIREFHYQVIDSRSSHAGPSGADMVTALKTLGTEADGLLLGTIQEAQRPGPTCRVDAPAAANGKHSTCAIQFPPSAPEVGRVELVYISYPSTGSVNLTLRLRGSDEERAVRAQAEARRARSGAGQDGTIQCPPPPGASGFVAMACKHQEKLRERMRRRQ